MSDIYSIYESSQFLSLKLFPEDWDLEPEVINLCPTLCFTEDDSDSKDGEWLGQGQQAAW